MKKPCPQFRHMFVQFPDNLRQDRPFLSILKMEGYEQRLKSGENKRELEKQGVRESLLKLGFDTAVLYRESGQPYLEHYPEFFVSISHSKGWFAVYVAVHPVGIDIEVENPRIKEGASYFVNEQEQSFIGNLPDLHLIWGAKEAFYKLKEGAVSDLKNEVTLTSIEPGNRLQVLFEQEFYTLQYYRENGVTVVFT